MNKWVYFAAAAIVLAVCIPLNWEYYGQGPIGGFVLLIEHLQINNGAKSISFDVLALYLAILVWMWRDSAAIGRRYFVIGFLLCTYVAAAAGLFLYLGLRAQCSQQAAVTTT